MSSICTFELHSHFVLVKDIRPAAIPALREAVRHQIQFTMVKQRGRFVRKMHKVFAAKNTRGTEYRFHINQLEYLYGIFGNMGIRRDRIRVSERPMYLPTLAEFKMDASKQARENQVDIISYIVDEGPTKVVTLQTGQGKSQPLGAKILVPGGWSTMGDMTVGTEVIAPDGKVVDVTGVYPQGSLCGWSIACEDGRRTIVAEEHLWRVMVDGVESVIQTSEIKELLRLKKKVFIPLPRPSKVTDLEQYIIDTRDLPISTTELASCLDRCTGAGIPYLDNLELTDIAKAHIPDVFLHGPVSVRETLLDYFFAMYRNSNITREFDYLNFQLASDIVELARSLGYMAYITEKKSNGYLRTVWNVTLRYPKEPWIRIKSVNRAKHEPMQCISLDSEDSLYITDDYVVTHNTFCGLKGGELIGERLIVQVLGRYFDKWVSDVAEAYNLDPDRVVAIRGASKLKTFLDLYHQDPEAMSFDVLIITSKTMQAYMVEYELTEFKHLPRGICRPEDIYESLGIGYRIIDEVHQHFHNNYKTDLYSHLPKSLYLSATMVPDDPFIKEMFNVAYPPKLRMDGGKLICYTNVTSIDYHLATRDPVKYLGPQGTYNQIVYEEWIMKDAKRLKGYLKLITDVYHQEFINKRKPGQKALIFAGSVEMCTIIVNHLKLTYTDLTIAKYTAEDDYDALMDSDTSVSTLGSSGTAVDIINLSVCIMTTAVSGSAANIQAVGRLRELKNYVPDKPHFLYFTCMDIPKHIEYKNKKKEILQGRVLTHRSVLYEDGV